MFYWCDVLKPDYLIFGFTMTNIAMILSEKFKIPCAGFILQPTQFPSKAYMPVSPISTHALDFFDKFEGTLVFGVLPLKRTI